MAIMRQTTLETMEATTLASDDGAVIAPGSQGSVKFSSVAAVILALLAFYVGLIIFGLEAIGPVPAMVADVSAPGVTQPHQNGGFLRYP
jgi:hypothetical protein